MLLISSPWVHRLGAILPKKFPSALTCLSTNALISAAASMVTLLTFLSSIPGCLDERRPELEIAAADVEGDCLTLEVLRLSDAVFLERENSDRRARPDSRNRDEVEPARRAVHH